MQLHGGFTLLELLVVLVIIGVMVSMATLSFGVLGGTARSKKRRGASGRCCARRARKRSCRPSTSAIFVRRPLTNSCASTRAATSGSRSSSDQLYAQRRLPEGLRFRLWLEAREIVLKPGPARPLREGREPEIPAAAHSAVERRRRAVRAADRARWRAGVVAHDCAGRRRPARRAARGRAANGGRSCRPSRSPKTTRNEGADVQCAPLNDIAASRSSKCMVALVVIVARHARRHPGRQPDGQQQRLPARQDHRALGRDEPAHRGSPAEIAPAIDKSSDEVEMAGRRLEVDDGTSRRRRSKPFAASTSACVRPKRRRAARWRRSPASTAPRSRRPAPR